MIKTREQYKEEAYEVMQDVEEVADLLEDRDNAEKAYFNGKSALAFDTINQLYGYLNDEHKAELASYLAKDAHEAMIKKVCIVLEEELSLFRVMDDESLALVDVAQFVERFKTELKDE